jgi:hypothetical protein
VVDAWPESLPQCFDLPFSEAEGDGLIEYQPDQGPTITRRRTAAVARPLSGTMRMTGAQLAALRSFRASTVLGGSLPFDFPDQTAGGAAVLVKFTKATPPSWQKIGVDAWRVSIALTVLP